MTEHGLQIFPIRVEGRTAAINLERLANKRFTLHREAQQTWCRGAALSGGNRILRDSAVARREMAGNPLCIF